MRVRVGRNLTSFPLPGKMTKVKLHLSVLVGTFVRSNVSKMGGKGKGLVTCAVVMYMLLKSLTSRRAAQQTDLVQRIRAVQEMAYLHEVESRFV